MNRLEQFRETIATYHRHGWRIKRVLMRPQTRAEVPASVESELFEGLTVEEDSVDALWFARPSHAGREAWELRQVADTPYALFETFEADEAEEDREDVRREMLARLRQRVNSE
ncbi:MAG TPA: hypothetical protein VF634_00245 [Pyrinomonadaceae bacterium]